MATITFVQAKNVSPLKKEFFSYYFAAKTDSGTVFDLRVDVHRSVNARISKSEFQPAKPEWLAALLATVTPERIMNRAGELVIELSATDVNENQVTTPSPVVGAMFDAANEDEELEKTIKTVQKEKRK